MNNKHNATIDGDKTIDAGLITLGIFQQVMFA